MRRHKFPRTKWLEKLEINNKSIHHDVLLVEGNTEKIRPACKSKYDANNTNCVNFLIIIVRKNGITLL